MLTLFKLALLCISMVSFSSYAAINIFACEPDWASLAKSHAPDADIYSATTAMQDPHYVQARPSLIAKIRRADIVICSGSELEIGWLPELQRQSRNNKIQSGKIGMFWVSDFVDKLDELEHVDRSMGDIHAHGNPHVQFAIDDIATISQALTARLSSIDPSNKTTYQLHGAKFRWQWQQKIKQWTKLKSELSGMQVVGYHSNFRYLFDWLNIQQVADLEPKPGIPPTMNHLNSLMQSDFSKVAGIVYSSHQPKDPAQWLSQHKNLPMIELAQSVGGQNNTESLIALVDDSISRLLTLANQRHE